MFCIKLAHRIQEHIPEIIAGKEWTEAQRVVLRGANQWVLGIGRPIERVSQRVVVFRIYIVLHMCKDDSSKD
ncbi:MAG: hypothetical protein NVSMB64_17300 [Candidatus Velthaea sp.]